MTVIINGETREIPEDLTVTALLQHLGIAGERIAIERNRDILPRSAWASTSVRPTDQFEIVNFVGGG